MLRTDGRADRQTDEGHSYNPLPLRDRGLKSSKTKINAISYCSLCRKSLTPQELLLAFQKGLRLTDTPYPQETMLICNIELIDSYFYSNQAAVGEYDELLATVKKRKLSWFGHV